MRSTRPLAAMACINGFDLRQGSHACIALYQLEIDVAARPFLQFRDERSFYLGQLAIGQQAEYVNADVALRIGNFAEDAPRLPTALKSEHDESLGTRSSGIG